MPEIRLPDDSKRLTIIGSTGSGKSQAGVWHLSNRSFNSMPWFVFNPKRDELIDSCGMIDFDFYDRKLPTKPGLYNFSPVPGSEADNEQVEKLLANIINRAVRNRQGSGVYFDEGYSIPKNSPSYRRILTQGRSLRVPSITLTQRPKWLDVFAFSEADFIQLFRLNRDEDIKTVAGWLPDNVPVYQRLPEFHSWYYDVGRNSAALFNPVPDADYIADRIKKRLGVRNKKQGKRIV